MLDVEARVHHECIANLLFGTGLSLLAAKTTIEWTSVCDIEARKLVSSMVCIALGHAITRYTMVCSVAPQDRSDVQDADSALEAINS